MGNTLAAAHNDIQHSKKQFHENAFENMLGPPSKTMDASGAVVCSFLVSMNGLAIFPGGSLTSRDANLPFQSTRRSC